MQNEQDKVWLTRKQAAMFLCSLGTGISAGQLGKMACHDNARKGPPFTRSGWNTVRYEREDLRAWAEANSVRVT